MPRTCACRVNSAPLSRLSYWTMDWYRPADSNGAPLAYRASALPAELDRRCWQGRLDSNQGHPTSEAGVLPLNYAPSVWRFPSVPIGALRFFRPALSPDQLEKHGIGAPASIRTGALLITRQVLCQLSYAGRGGSASIRTKDFRVMSPALWPSKLRNLVLGGGFEPPASRL